MTLSPVISASTTALITMTRPTVCLRVTFPLRLGAPSEGSGRDSSDTGLTFDRGGTG